MVGIQLAADAKTAVRGCDDAPRREGPAGLRIGPVESTDRDELRALLGRLSEGDLRMRFLRAVPTTALDDYAAKINLDGATRLGAWTDEGRLVALVEGFPFVARGTPCMELAFATDPAWRRIGLAALLSKAIVADAAARGVRQVVSSCDARNVPMRALLASARATTRVEDGEVDAEWPLCSSNARLH